MRIIPLEKLHFFSSAGREPAARQSILPVVFFVIFLLLYMVFHSVMEALVLIFPTVYAMTGGLLLQWWLGYNFSVAVGRLCRFVPYRGPLR